MPTSETCAFIRHLLRDGAGLTDGQLLADYTSRRDELALAALVRRHGPMVWGTCRRIVCNHHDAEDAFQATFLVLVRKAASIAAPELVANWLHGVAHQTALKARAMTAKRRAREREVAVMPEPAATERNLYSDVQPLLDQELSRLPDKYRVAIVLCELEAKTRKEAARQLGVPEGTLAARLARGRVLLAKRLARRGVTVPGGLLAAVLAENAAASVPTSVVSSTIKAATLWVAGSGAVSANVAVLTEGVLTAMFMTKLKIATAVFVTVAILGTALGWFTHRALAGHQAAAVQNASNQDRTDVHGLVKAVDASRNTIMVHFSKEFPGEETFTLARDAKVFLDDGTGDKLGFQEGKLADVIEGSPITFRLSPEQRVSLIWVEGPTLHGVLQNVDLAKRRITATVALAKSEPATDHTFTVARNAKLFIDDGKAPDKSKPATPPSLADLPLKAVLSLKLSADRKSVGSLRAEGQTVTGRARAVHGVNDSITVTIATKGEPDVDRTFPLAKFVQVFIDDGKPKHKVKPEEAQRAADVPIGAHVSLRLAFDGQTVIGIVAEGGNVHGTVKAVDLARNTLTLHDKEVEDGRTYSLLPDAVVFVDDKSEIKKVANLPLEAVVDLKLLADQRTVREIRAYGPTVLGRVVGNAGNDSITIGDKEGDKTFVVPRGAYVLIDEKREGKLTEFIDGTVAQVRLSLDRTTALELRGEGPSFRGTVKGLDPDKNSIILTIGAKLDIEDKEFKLTKETAVLTEISSVPLKLADLRADREVILRLAIDQKAAVRITVVGE